MRKIRTFKTWTRERELVSDGLGKGIFINIKSTAEKISQNFGNGKWNEQKSFSEMLMSTNLGQLSLKCLCSIQGDL